MDQEDDFPGPMNLGNPVESSILEIAETVLRLTHSRSDIEHRPLPENDPVRRCPDIGLARQKMNWEPSVNLEQGLQATIDYFKRTLEL
jgi:UDP-glucuronate decarboxylase